MRISIIILALAIGQASQLSAQALKNKIDSISYGIGVMVAQNFAKDGIDDINSTQLAAGVDAVMSSSTPLISQQEAMALFNKMIEEGKKMKFQDQLLVGQAHLAENATKEGVTTTASGLQYEVISSGSGPKPGPSDKVTTHYHGTLLDGTVFDSSVDRGEPISFPVGGVIKGWQEALQLMSVGDKWKLTIPYDLAYGERGAGASIPPFATLIFEVELIAID